MESEPQQRGVVSLARELLALTMVFNSSWMPRPARMAVAVVSIVVCPPLDWATKPQLLRRLLWGVPIPPAERRTD